jgi:hypothetical protein
VRRACNGAARLAGARDRARRALELHAARRVLRARHRLAQGRRHARKRLPRRERAHPGRPHDAMRQRLAAVRAATAAIRPALVHFYEALDQGQKVRFAGMS